MRETRLSGLEGGVALTAPSLPLSFPSGLRQSSGSLEADVSCTTGETLSSTSSLLGGKVPAGRQDLPLGLAVPAFAGTVILAALLSSQQTRHVRARPKGRRGVITR
jgi:hypothetical protein